MERRQHLGLIPGPLLFLAALLVPLPDGMTPAAQSVAAVVLLMMASCITGAIPIPVTALLPLGLFPLLGAVPMTAVSGAGSRHGQNRLPGETVRYRTADPVRDGVDAAIAWVSLATDLSGRACRRHVQTQRM